MSAVIPIATPSTCSPTRSASASQQRDDFAAAAARTRRPRRGAAGVGPAAARPAGAVLRAGGRDQRADRAAPARRRGGRSRAWRASARPRWRCTSPIAWPTSFPDGQLYLDLRASLPPAEALGYLLRALGIPDHGGDLAETAARFRSALAGRRMLLVLDDAATVDQIRPLLPAPAAERVVTSRRALDTLPQAHHLRLDVLPEAEALDLLAAYAGAERTEADPVAAREVVQQCGLLPLAVHLAGARLASRPGWPLAYLADRLAVRRLDELDRDDAGIRASFAVSVDQLDPADQGAFTLFGVFEDISLPVAARLLDVDELDAELVLERLADLHLMQAHHPWPVPDARPRPCLRAGTARRLPSGEPGRRPLRRGGVASITLVVAAQLPRDLGRRRRGRTERTGLRHRRGGVRLARRAPLHLLDLCRTPGVPRALVRLAPGLFTYYLSRGFRLDWAEVCRAALGASCGRWRTRSSRWTSASRSTTSSPLRRGLDDVPRARERRRRRDLPHQPERGAGADR